MFNIPSVLSEYCAHKLKSSTNICSMEALKYSCKSQLFLGDEWLPKNSFSGAHCMSTQLLSGDWSADVCTT